jgi:hypothetical protein
MKIIVHWYDGTGRNRREIETFDSITAAYIKLNVRAQFANAWPEGSQNGLYRWEPSTIESLERFTKAMQSCS